MAELNKKFAQMSSKRLRELLQVTDGEESKQAIRDVLEARGTLQADKYVVMKKIGSFGTTVIREFDDRDKAENFVTLLRESEQSEFTQYTLAKRINF